MHIFSKYWEISGYYWILRLNSGAEEFIIDIELIQESNSHRDLKKDYRKLIQEKTSWLKLTLN